MAAVSLVRDYKAMEPHVIQAGKNQAHPTVKSSSCTPRAVAACWRKSLEIRRWTDTPGVVLAGPQCCAKPHVGDRCELCWTGRRYLGPRGRWSSTPLTLADGQVPDTTSSQLFAPGRRQRSLGIAYAVAVEAGGERFSLGWEPGRRISAANGASAASPCRLSGTHAMVDGMDAGGSRGTC